MKSVRQKINEQYKVFRLSVCRVNQQVSTTVEDQVSFAICHSYPPFGYTVLWELRKKINEISKK